MCEFKLHPYDWMVRVYYLDITDDDEVREIHDCLDSLGYDGKHPASIDDIFTGENTGMTYSDTISKRTLIIIGRTSSAEECANTIIHERLHLAMHVCKTFGIDPYSEESAYLSGQIGAMMYKSARVLLCSDCREKHSLL